MFNIITITLYAIGAIIQIPSVLLSTTSKNQIFFYVVSAALVFHGFLLYQWIDLSAGQNLAIGNLFSLATWVGCTILFLTFNKHLRNLMILMCPLAAMSIFLAGYFPSDHIIQTADQPKQLVHILLSIVTFSLLLIAGLQAVTLAFQEKFLKQKQLEMSGTFPPIETMEKMLFQMIAAGSVLLTLVLLSSIYFFHEVLLEQFLQKTILTFLSLCVFIFLLIARHFFGWRGKKAVYCTLGGLGILCLIYFSSMIIMELLP